MYGQMLVSIFLMLATDKENNFQVRAMSQSSWSSAAIAYSDIDPFSVKESCRLSFDKLGSGKLDNYNK